MSRKRTLQKELNEALLKLGIANLTEGFKSGSATMLMVAGLLGIDAVYYIQKL